MEMSFNMVSAPLQRLRMLLHRNPEPQEEAPADSLFGGAKQRATAKQDTDTFFRRGTTRPPRAIDQARRDLLGQDAAPSSPPLRTSQIWRFASTIARRGGSVRTKETPKVKLESPFAAAVLTKCQSQPTSPLASSPLGHRATRKLDWKKTILVSAAEETCLAHPRGGCSCTTVQVATMTGGEAWTVMARRFKAAKAVHAHTELECLVNTFLLPKAPARAQRRPAAPQSSKPARVECLRAPAPPPALARTCCNESPRAAHRRVDSPSPLLARRPKLLPLPALKCPTSANPALFERRRNKLAVLESVQSCPSDFGAPGQ
ncbi:hypothetical protein T484DRAFT_1965786 [Baffinella frigidus]|nr:hypothetical protein T484DRAFT_1965786 [Cryptophyta sp. CCMP2293]